MKEKNFYEKIKDWDFSHIKMTEEKLTDWELYDELERLADEDTIALDLGCGGGEKVLKFYPKVKELLATDYSPEMIKTANENLLKSGKTGITFRVMNNLEMDTPKEYFDIVTCRHTVINAKQIYEALKPGGHLILRGVDKLDCWKLKMMFGHGQAYFDTKPISQIDLEDIINAGFKRVELIPLHVREYYETREDLLALLLKTPILVDFSEENQVSYDVPLDLEILDKYIEENTTSKGIELIRRYYGIIATK